MGGHVSLHQAVRQNAHDSLTTLCERSRDLNVKEDVEQLQWTALQFAAWIGNYKAIEILADFGAAINITDAHGSTALHLAASRGKVIAARRLLDVGADVNATDEHGMTPLHRAAMEGNDEMVKLLCQRLADVNRADKQGATPLHLACFEGHLIIVYLLLEAGASVLVVDHNGNTPLHDAAAGGHQVIMYRLVLRGAQAGLRNMNNLTAETLLKVKRTQTVEVGIEDSQSTTNMSDTMSPSTPPVYNWSVAASSSIDARSLSGSSNDDVSAGEVTSHWKGARCDQERNVDWLNEGWASDKESRFEGVFNQRLVDPEPKAPPRDTGFESEDPL